MPIYQLMCPWQMHGEPTWWSEPLQSAGLLYVIMSGKGTTVALYRCYTASNPAASFGKEGVRALNSCREKLRLGHGDAGHAPQLLLHAQDGRPVHVQQLCTGEYFLPHDLLYCCSRDTPLVLDIHHCMQPRWP